MAACDMIFEIEVEDGDLNDARTSCQRPSNALRQAIRALTSPQGVYESQVLRRVREVKAGAGGCGERETLWRIVEGLTGGQYIASLVRSVGGGWEATACDRLHHSFVEVLVDDWEATGGDCDLLRGHCQWPGGRNGAGASADWDPVTGLCQGPWSGVYGAWGAPKVCWMGNGERDDNGVGGRRNALVVEPALRDVFVIGEQTERYGEVLGLVPDEFVGPRDRLVELVRLMCKEMEAAFVAFGRAVPPWRRFRSVASRWSPPHFRRQAVETGSLGPTVVGPQISVCKRAVGLLPLASAHNEGAPVRGVSGFCVGRLPGARDVRSAWGKDPKLRGDAGKMVLARMGSAIRVMG